MMLFMILLITTTTKTIHISSTSTSTKDKLHESSLDADNSLSDIPDNTDISIHRIYKRGGIVSRNSFIEQSIRDFNEKSQSTLIVIDTEHEKEDEEEDVAGVTEESKKSEITKENNIEEQFSDGITIIVDNSNDDQNEVKKDAIYRDMENHYEEIQQRFGDVIKEPLQRKHVRLIVITPNEEAENKTVVSSSKQSMNNVVKIESAVNQTIGDSLSGSNSIDDEREKNSELEVDIAKLKKVRDQMNRLQAMNIKENAAAAVVPSTNADWISKDEATPVKLKMQNVDNNKDSLNNSSNPSTVEVVTVKEVHKPQLLQNHKLTNLSKETTSSNETTKDQDKTAKHVNKPLVSLETQLHHHPQQQQLQQHEVKPLKENKRNLTTTVSEDTLLERYSPYQQDTDTADTDDLDKVVKNKNRLKPPGNPHPMEHVNDSPVNAEQQHNNKVSAKTPHYIKEEKTVSYKQQTQNTLPTKTTPSLVLKNLTRENTDKTADINDKTGDYTDKSRNYNAKTAEEAGHYTDNSRDYNDKTRHYTDKVDHYTDKTSQYTDKSRDFTDKTNHYTDKTRHYNDKTRHYTDKAHDFTDKTDETDSGNHYNKNTTLQSIDRKAENRMTMEKSSQEKNSHQTTTKDHQSMKLVKIVDTSSSKPVENVLKYSGGHESFELHNQTMIDDENDSKTVDRSSEQQPENKNSGYTESEPKLIDNAKAEAIIEFLNKDPLETWRYPFNTLTSLDLNATVLRSGLVNPGDIERLKGVMRRALDGKDIVLSIVGGSISAGGGLYKDLKSIDGLYYKGVVDWWNKMITPLTGSAMVINNIAIGSIGTDYFSYCVKNHIRPDTDIVIWELSANDYNRYKMLPTKGARPLERLTRTVLALPKSPALIYLNFFKGIDYKNSRDSCPNFEDQEEDVIAHYYKIPSLSWRTMVCKGLIQNQPGFQMANLFSKDQYHPSLKGHAQASLLILLHLRHVMRAVLQWAMQHDGAVKSFEKTYALPEPLFMGPKYPHPYCWTLISPNISDQITNTLQVRVMKDEGFAMGYATDFPIRYDKVACWKAVKPYATLSIFFTIPESVYEPSDKRYEISITTHTRWGGSSFIWLDDNVEKATVIREGRPGDPGKRTQVDTVLSDVLAGTHTLNVQSSESGFCLSAIMIDAS